MLKKFIRTVRENQLIQIGDKIVIGVSGGPDSICLLHLLWSIREDFKLTLYAVHLNHQFRGKEAEEDGEYVRRFCEKLGVQSFFYSEDVTKYSQERGISFEEGGRELRYKSFYEIFHRMAADKIAIAQNLDDQAETVLMRLFRGSGLEGLGAMNYARDDTIIRPLLDISRKEIERYCDQYQLEPRIDRTNLESIYTRNRVRLELIPYIEKHFNPNIKSTLCRTARLLQEENEFIEEMAEEYYSKIIRKTGSNIYLDISLFKACHNAIQKRVLRKVFQQTAGSLKNLEHIHIQGLADLILLGQAGNQLNLPYGIIAILEYDYCILQKQEDLNKNEDFEYVVNIGERQWLEVVRAYLYCEVSNREKGFEISSQIYKKHFDYDKIKGELLLRNRRPGDRFSPLGLQGSKKLKDYFIDEKIPQRKRADIPLLCDRDQIIWIIGHRISEKYKIDSDTKRILTVYYEPI